MSSRRSAPAPIRSILLLVLGFGLVGGPGLHPARGASRAGTIRYDTVGTIGSDGVAGLGVVRFDGVDGATARTPVPYPVGQIPGSIPGDRSTWLDLGRFEVRTPGPGTVTAYDHTPFAIRFQLDAADGQGSTPGRDSFVVRGWLDGMVGGDGSSTLTAHYQLAGAYGLPFEPRNDVGSFEASGANQTLTIPGFGSSLATPGAIGPAVMTEVGGLLVGDSPLPSPAPEPSTVFGFLAVGAAVALRARARRRAVESGHPARP